MFDYNLYKLLSAGFSVTDFHFFLFLNFFFPIRKRFGYQNRKQRAIRVRGVQKSLSFVFFYGSYVNTFIYEENRKNKLP